MKIRATLVVVTLGLCACTGHLPSGPRDGEITIRTDEITYRPSQMILVTTTNRSSRIVYDDHCGGGVEGYEFLQEWNASYGMGRLCYDQSSGEWLEHAVAIRPGELHVDTLHVNGMAYSGTWRVQLYLRDESGAVLSEGERVSNTFRVNGTWTP